MVWDMVMEKQNRNHSGKTMDPQICKRRTANPPPRPPLTCVRAQVALECGVAGEGAVALAADVAPDARVHLHVLLQRRLSLEALPAQQAEDGHVRA